METIHRLTAYCVSLALCLMLAGQLSHVMAAENSKSVSSPHAHHVGGPATKSAMQPCHDQLLNVMSGNCPMEAGCQCHMVTAATISVRSDDLSVIDRTTALVTIAFVGAQSLDWRTLLQHRPPSLAPPVSSRTAYKLHFSRTMRQLA